MKNNRRSYRVTLDVPDGVNDTEMKAYIEEAVAVWKGQKHPEDPLFDLDGKSVKVSKPHKPKRQLPMEKTNDVRRTHRIS